MGPTAAASNSFYIYYILLLYIFSFFACINDLCPKVYSKLLVKVWPLFSVKLKYSPSAAG